MSEAHKSPVRAKNEIPYLQRCRARMSQVLAAVKHFEKPAQMEKLIAECTNQMVQNVKRAIRKAMLLAIRTRQIRMPSEHASRAATGGDAAADVEGTSGVDAAAEVDGTAVDDAAAEVDGTAGDDVAAEVDGTAGDDAAAEVDGTAGGDVAAEVDGTAGGDVAEGKGKGTP